MGKIIRMSAFGAGFCLALPLLLYWWALKTQALIDLPVPAFEFGGLLLAWLGLGLMLWAMLDLWFRGGGLPMSAFPPQRYVSDGAYAFFKHPIYVGAALMTYGVAWYYGSAAGFWLVAPVFTLLIVAYIQGFERQVIARHFACSHRPFFFLPAADEPLTPWRRWGVACLVFVPWLLIYELFVFLGVPVDAFTTTTRLDAHIPLIATSVVCYVVLYPMVVLLPFILSSTKQAREFAWQSAWGMVLIFYCYLVIPAVMDNRALSADDVFVRLIIWGRDSDSPAAAFPSFHVFWALMVGQYYGRRFAAWRMGFALLSALIIISCLTTGNHSLADVVAGMIAYVLVYCRYAIYRQLLRGTERIANSWQEWRWRSLRLINHGFYAAAGAFCGFWLMAWLLPDKIWVVYCLGISGFIGAASWAQWLEGSSLLLRPFGYYGSVGGILLGATLLTAISDVTLWQLLGMAAMAACPIQFFGRGRCLIQGCCHGQPCASAVGIRFTQPNSRVRHMAGWQGESLYPTQLYSMIANVLIFFFLWRLLRLNMPAAFIAGMYLILSSGARFVEESWRGEPQTPSYFGLRLYQWTALATLLLGVVLTTIHSAPLRAGEVTLGLFIHATIYALIVLVVYGVDFPDSNVRFSRLTQ